MTTDPYLRIVLVFDQNETAGRFIPEDGEGGFAAGVSRMADEIERLQRVIAWANNSLFGSHGFFLSLNGGDPDEHHLDRAIEDLKELNRKGYTAARRQALIDAAKLIDEGFDRGIQRKHDTCSHGKFQWEDCDQCAAAAICKLAEDRDNG